MKLILWLQGKKTFFLAFLYGVAAVLWFLKLIPDDVYLTLKGLLEAGMGITIAAKVNRMRK